MFKYLTLITILFSSPSLSWGCEKREYGDRKDERQTWEQVFNKLSDNTRCVTNESLLRREILVEQREKALEREIQSAFPIMRNEIIRKAASCYTSTNNYLEYTGCLESVN